MVTLQITMIAGGSITWPASIRWPGGTAPTLSTGQTHLVMLTPSGVNNAIVLGSFLTGYTI
jgi:hypothetical protein